jgi:hypothetical protein
MPCVPPSAIGSTAVENQNLLVLCRIGILHGMFDGYGDTINFYRLVSLLDPLCFVLVLSHGGSSFAPEAEVKCATRR